jgi:hypothetical protein
MRPDETLDNLRRQTRELTLMLLYLNAFEDGGCRSWKGYDFDDLEALAEQGFISGSRRAKSVYLSEEGIDRAKELCAEHGIELSPA